MEPARHLHGLCELGIVVCIEVPAVRHETGDFPAATGVLEHEGGVETEISGGLQCGFFCLAVHEELGAHAGMTVDPFAVVGCEVAAEVGESLLERVHIPDFGLVASKNRDDVVEDLGVKILQEKRVEVAQLIERVKLMDDGRVVLSDSHVKFADMLGIEILPELVLRLGEVILVFQDLAEARGELAVEVGMTDHVPCIGAADRHFGDSIVSSRLQTPFGCLSLVVLG